MYTKQKFTDIIKDYPEDLQQLLLKIRGRRWCFYLVCIYGWIQVDNHWYIKRRLNDVERMLFNQQVERAKRLGSAYIIGFDRLQKNYFKEI